MTKMELFFLDSAAPSEVELAAASGIVCGVTTNPAIIRAAAPTVDPLEHVRRVFELFPDGPVFHQLHAADATAGEAQANELLGLLARGSDRLVFKLPAQPEWYGLGSRLVRRGHQVAFTAVYQPGQFLAAAQVGAGYVIPYVDRARRLRPQSPDVVRQLASVATAGFPSIVAASIKSATQGIEAFRAGANAITAPWPVIEELMRDPLTDSAVEEFRELVPT